MRNMLRTDANCWGEAQEKKMTGQIKNNQDIKDDKESLKGQENKENRKYLHFIFNVFDHYTVLRSSF